MVDLQGQEAESDTKMGTLPRNISDVLSHGINPPRIAAHAPGQDTGRPRRPSPVDRADAERLPNPV
jgi:hypothetical protein